MSGTVERAVLNAFRPRLSGSDIKWIGIVTMLADHVAVILLGNGLMGWLNPAYEAWVMQSEYGARLWSVAFWLRMAGRMAFPAFCLLLVEGFVHTRSYKRYMGRLLLFALISEVPYDLAIYGRLWEPAEQNVMFSLAAGLGALWLLQRVERAGGMGQGAAYALILGSVGAAAEFLRLDYGFIGILTIGLMYLGRDQRWIRFAAVCMMSFWVAGRAYLPGGIIAGIIVCLYDGRRGSARFKWLFYWFYPAHLLALGLVCRWLPGMKGL